MQHENNSRTQRNDEAASKSASWPLLAAGFLSQAVPSAAPLFHSCAMLVAMRKSRREQHFSSTK